MEASGGGAWPILLQLFEYIDQPELELLQELPRGNSGTTIAPALTASCPSSLLNHNTNFNDARSNNNNPFSSVVWNQIPKELQIEIARLVGSISQLDSIKSSADSNQTRAHSSNIEKSNDDNNRISNNNYWTSLFQQIRKIISEEQQSKSLVHPSDMVMYWTIVCLLFGSSN